MARVTKGEQDAGLLTVLVQNNALFHGLDQQTLAHYLEPEQLVREKLYASRPIYTAFRPNISLEYLYAILCGEPVIIRSAPLDRIIALTYPGSCFGTRDLELSLGRIHHGLPSLVESYKTTDVVKIPLEVVQKLHHGSLHFQERYRLLIELREKFQYHPLNCSTYPPQAV